MIAPKTVYVSEKGNPPPDFRLARDPLISRIETLLAEERDAVRRRDWPAARSAAEERVTLQETRRRATVRRLS